MDINDENKKERHFVQNHTEDEKEELCGYIVVLHNGKNILKRRINECTKCLCDRPKRKILCTNCGYIMTGRLACTCPEHSKASFLFDINICFACEAKQYMLHEIHELEKEESF